MKKQLLLFLLIYTASHSFSFAQKSKIDSLLTVLKKAKDDTNKVNTLNTLSSLYIDAEASHQADSISQTALILAKQLNYRSGMAASYNTISYACEDQGNFSEATKYQYEVLKIQKEIGNRKGIASAYNNIGNNCAHQGNYGEALTNYRASLEIQKELGNKKGIANSYNNIGNIFYFQGNYPVALKNFLDGLKAREENGDEKGVADSQINIGALYFMIKNYTEALKNYQASMEISKKLDMKKNIALNYVNIADVYLVQGDYADALKNNLLGLQIFERIDDKYNIGTTYYLIAKVYIIQNNFSEATKNLGAAIKIQKETGDKEGLANSLEKLGKVNSKLMNTQEALENIKEALALAKKMGLKENMKNCYLTLTTIDSIKNNWKDAYVHQQLYHLYSDSLFNEESTKKTTQQQMQYDFDKKESLTKADQDKRDAIAEVEKHRQKVITYSVSGGLLLMLLLAGFIYRGYRHKQKANIIITQQKKEVEHQKEIVEEKQKEIVDSINYAKRIQNALLAGDGLLKANLPDYFIFFQPKDIVSGDFYWAIKNKNTFYLATADSTGHGVPGAFMSLLNISFLNEAITEKHIEAPNEILNHTRKRLIESLKSDGSEEGGKDGMDCILSAFDFSANTLTYAAANNSFYIIRKKSNMEVGKGDVELLTYKADKMPVGKSLNDDQSFTQQTIQLQKGDIIYTLTDGFADQFGGPKGKKFKYKQLADMLFTHYHLPMEEQKNILSETINNWKGNMEQVDDILVIGIRI